MAFHNSVKFGRQFVAGPAGDRDPVRLEVAFGRQARRVEGVAGVEWYVRGGPVGVAVPVLYQRPDGSAHVINAVRTGSKDPAGRDVVVLWDPQRGEEAEGADVSAVTGMWVIPVPEPVAGPAGMVVLPPSGSGLRSQGWGSGLPTEVTGKASPKGAKRTRAETGESSRGAKRRKVTAAAAGIDPGSPGNYESELLTPTDQPVQQDEREAERKQKNRAKNAKHRQGLRAAADRVAELEELAGQGSLTEEQAAELAELQPKVAKQRQQNREAKAKQYAARRAVADRVVVLEELAGQGALTEEQEAELAALQLKVAQQKQQNTETNAKQYQARRAAAERVVVLEELKGCGLLTEELAAELAELQPKVAKRKQQKKAMNAKEYQARKVVANRVAELEELAGRGELTEEQAAELAELQPKVAQRKQQSMETYAKQYQARRGRSRSGCGVGGVEGVRAADGGAGGGAGGAPAEGGAVETAREGKEPEALSGEKGCRRPGCGVGGVGGAGELTEEQAAELAELQPKVAQRKQQSMETYAKQYQARRAEADRVVVLEELKGCGLLTEELAAELAELQPKVEQWKQHEKEKNLKHYQARKVAAARVAELDELAGRAELTEEQAAELAELQPKVEQWKQQKKAKNAKEYQARKVAAARVAELEELAGRAELTEEQAAELAELQPKVAQRGRKKKDRWVMETGVGGAGALVGRDERTAGPEGVSEWTGTDQDDRDAWSADFDLGAWLDQAVADLAVSSDAGAGDAGADDFAGFLPDYHDWADPVGLFGVEGPDEGSFGDPFPEDAVWPDGVWPDAVGSGDRFVRGVNQASYLIGDARFRVNCLEACVAFHNSVKFGRQFVAGPAGDRDPVRLEVAFGRQARRVEGVAGVEQYVRSGPVGVAVPVLYQRADGSAHVINAVRTGSKDPAGRDVVVLWDPQRGEEAEKADVSAVTGMWVIPVPEEEPDQGMVVLPSSGSGLRSQGWGSGLPTEVTGPKRQPGASGPEAGKTGSKGTKRTRAEADEGSRAGAGESSRGTKRRKVTAAAAGIDPGSPGNDE